MLSTGQVLQDRYEIIKVVGKGGMSTVYQARDLTNGNLLAIKDVARGGGDGSDLIERTLVSEGNMLKSLSSPHLPKIYDFIVNPENYLLVMDFINGESLDRVIAREGAQPMDKVLNWGMQICEVFDYLHNQPTPIIYRDMKPANVILQPNGHLMMIDFGTARTQKTNLAMSADTICFGTEGFAAPEQFGGIGQSTARTDIFCLGGTLYNMITGHSPCDRPKGILPLEQWNPALKDCPLSHIITKCTRQDPDARYQTARELYADLKRARDGTFVADASTGRSGKAGGAAWQKQNTKSSGRTNGLSGLLKQGKSPPQAPPHPHPSPPPAQVGTASPWQTGVQYPPEPPPQQYAYQQHYPQQPPQQPAQQTAQQTDHPWRKITILGVIVAAVMLLLGLVMMLITPLGGLIFMVMSLIGIALALVGVILTKKAEAGQG